MGEYYSGIFVSDEALAHYGIKGQKWGVRRFQYENGSYTPEGKERYGVKAVSDKKNSKNDKNALIAKKVLIGAGVVTLSAVAGYLIFKNASRPKISFPNNWPKDALVGDRSKDKLEIEKHYSKEIANKLTEQEKDAIKYYTSEGYADMNYILGLDKSGNNPYYTKSANNISKSSIERSMSYKESVEKKIEVVKEALDKMETPRDMIVNRKTQFAYLRGMFGDNITGSQLADLLKSPEKAIGKIVEAKPFCSTSIDSSANGTFGVCNLHILVPKGSKGAYVASISGSPKEQEFLLQCGSKYRVSKIQNFNPDQESIYASSVEIFLELLND